MSRAIGAEAEERARLYLLQQGMQWVSSNYRTRWGEIDLIMRDHGVIVFVEVRARKSALFGGGLASVGHQKQQKLIRTANAYLQRYKLHEACAARFDVISLDGLPPVITWVAGAFTC